MLATAAPRSVLCADTDPAFVQNVASILPACEMIGAMSGFEALRALNSRTFDLYLLDYWLPDWSGVQLCKEIRKTDPRGPVFFCTSAGRTEDRKRAIRAGATAFLTKPLDVEQFARQTRIAFELADLNSLRAKVEEERAVHEELARLSEIAKARAVDARAATAQAMRRTARTRAYKAFIEGGGTRANFERMWPQVFSGVDEAAARAASR
jgi:DNA-binding NtrC family response regulator